MVLHQRCHTLSGLTVFLHELDDNKERECLLKKLQSVGARVSSFLGKQIDYIITRKKKKKNLRTSSPPNLPMLTRTNRIFGNAQKAAVYGCSNVFKIAQKWKIEIITIAEANELLLMNSSPQLTLWGLYMNTPMTVCLLNNETYTAIGTVCTPVE